MKRKRNLFLILGVISYMIGLAMVLVCSLNEKLDIQLGISGKIILGIGGVVFIIGAVGFSTLFIVNYANGDEDLKIEENDERNIMIRGKAAEISMLITVLMMLTVTLILICIDDTTAAFLVAIPMFICGFVHMLLIGYYQKKY